MSTTETMTVTLIRLECGKCHVPFAISKSKYDRCQNDQEGFWCPNGHRLHFTEPMVKRLQREIQQLDQRNAELRQQATSARSRAEHERYRARAYQGHLTRTKKRIAAGVCPCCRRHFDNLQAHMNHQHPDYAGRNDG